MELLGWKLWPESDKATVYCLTSTVEPEEPLTLKRGTFRSLPQCACTVRAPGATEPPCVWPHFSITSADLIKKTCQLLTSETAQRFAQTAAFNSKSLLLRPSLDKWSVTACKVSWSRQEGVKSLISPPQKKFLLEASLCWFPAFLPNALFLLISALEYQGQLFPCH